MSANDPIADISDAHYASGSTRWMEDPKARTDIAMSSNSPRPQIEKLIEMSDGELAEAVRISQEHEPQDRFCWHLEAEASLQDPFDAKFYDTVRCAFGPAVGEPPAELVTVSFGAFEIWDHASPSQEWLRRRAFQLDEIAAAAGAKVVGWSYEPAGFPDNVIPQVFLSSQPDT